MSIVLRAGSATDAGRVRTNNQDRVLVVDGRLFAVADGMGGHRGGEVAAQMVVDGLREFAEFETDTVSPGSIESRLRALNTTILRAASGSDELFGMGTTLTMVVQADRTSTDGSLAVPALYVVNIGDSRTYLLRNGSLEQLTEDHSVIADLIRRGKITDEEAKTHRQRSVITRSIGVDANVDPDILEVTPSFGSRYLLCSDGLTNEVPDSLIGAVLRKLADPQEAARELVRLAVERGGRDNVSVVVVDVSDDSGHDELALRASADVDSEAAAGRRRHRGNDAEHGTRPVEVAKTPRRKRVRTPSPITPRVALFFALLAGIAALIYVVVTQAPKDPSTTQPANTTVSTTLTTGTTSVPSPTDTSTVAGTSDTSTGGTSTSDSAPDTVAVTEPPPVTATTVLVGPTQTIDDFAPANATDGATTETTRARTRRRTTR